MAQHKARVILELVVMTYYQFSNGWTVQAVSSRDGSLITCAAWPYHQLDPVFGKEEVPTRGFLDLNELGEWLDVISKREPSS